MVHVQHLAVRVSDLDRSLRFYSETFRGQIVLEPYFNGVEMTEFIMGVRDTDYRIGYVQPPDGFGLELFQFVPDRNPVIGVPQPKASYMHFAIAVEDLDDTLERAKASGGEVLGGPSEWVPSTDPGRYAYVADPDRNILEINDTTWERILASAVEIYPQAAPDWP